MTPHVFLLAGFADGFSVMENEEDHSAFVNGRNFFYDLLHGLHEHEHGRMIFMALWIEEGPFSSTYNIEWKQLPDNARPIRFKHMERESVSGEWLGPTRLKSVDFGYQYTDENDQNVQVVKQIAIGS